jgi:Flp pilus assembly secretin CpaC
VGLNITPSINTKLGGVDADIEVNVSNVDYGNAVKVGETGSVPAMRTRRAKTTISVASDETIVIAGLLNTEKSTVTEGIPVLSWIPFLGELFKNTSQRETHTELIIFVTPHVVAQ